MKKQPVRLAELSIDQLQIDPDNPRDLKKEKEDDPSKIRLLRSIEKLGIENPLVVCAMKVEDRFLIIDGHRRYLCAKTLDMKTVPCLIYPILQPSELALRRFEVQNNRMEWGPFERAEAFAQIKRAEGFEKDKELAGYLGLSPGVVSSSLRLLNQHSRYMEQFEAHELSETYAVEFSHIRDFIRDIREFDVVSIIDILLKKAKHRVLKNAKDFRIVGKVFLKANRYEEQLHAFLKDPDMTTDELRERTGETWLAHMMEQVLQAIAKRYSIGEGLTAEEEAHRRELQDFLNGVDPRTTNAVPTRKVRSARTKMVATVA